MDLDCIQLSPTVPLPPERQLATCHTVQALTSNRGANALVPARPPPTDFGEPHRSGPLWRVQLGGRHGGLTARGRALFWGVVRGSVLLCACTCLHMPVRACGGVGASVRVQVCAPKCTVRCASACVRPWVWGDWLWVADAHCHGQPGPAW